MKTRTLVAALLLLVTPAFGTSALAGLPIEAEDIHTGDDLGAACTALVNHDVSAEDDAAAKACKSFLGDMVRNVVKATEPGAPTKFNRVGPTQDTTLCFEISTKLSFDDFAKQVVAYHKAHPELDDRPAYEIGAWSLATNFPCAKDIKAP